MCQIPIGRRIYDIWIDIDRSSINEREKDREREKRGRERVSEGESERGRERGRERARELARERLIVFIHFVCVQPIQNS